ncbi:hypothetical protein [Salipaludibacillus daqingensis]|nr:hypothetical protein [Salipaludibacillus daqingensis]
MYQSYGIGYEEYNRKLDNRLKVEEERERNYQQSLSMVGEYQRQQIHT